MIGVLATGEDPAVHVAKLVLAGLVAVGLLAVVIYAFAAPAAVTYRFLRRRRATAADPDFAPPMRPAPAGSHTLAGHCQSTADAAVESLCDVGPITWTASSQDESSQ